MIADVAHDRLAALENDNRRLRRLLDQRDAPGELRHRLRNTLSLLRAVVRQSARTERDLPGFVAHFEDRLDAIARAQALADQHGEIDLRVLLADELLHYGAQEGETLSLSGPDIRFQPKAGQILALALHELAANAVQHGPLGTENGRLAVSWDITEDDAGTAMRLIWTEFGDTRQPQPSATAAHGFGTQILTHVLAYDLRAKTEITWAAEGLRCTIDLPLQQWVGRVDADGIW